MSAPKLLFITGMLRSGTTLLEKLVNIYHPSATILYQPCMPIFTGVKNAFLNSLGYKSDRYPLGPLFCETRYRLDDFSVFLEGYRPKDWPGVAENVVNTNRYRGCLAEILPKLWLGLSGNSESEILGAKEVLCEEYTPHLARHGFKIIIILRDPRDIIASMNYGKASLHVGAVRPTLYNIRNWRKSVAFALHLNELGLVRYVRYEDLVQNPEQYLKDILFWLGMDTTTFQLDKRSGLKNNEGKNWSGNSSFSNKSTISTESVGQFKKVLPRMLIKYIEALCEPEMSALGYQSYAKSEEDFEIILNSFREPLAVKHLALPSDYSSSSDNIANEIFRRKLITCKDCSNETESEHYFLFKELGNNYRQFIVIN